MKALLLSKEIRFFLKKLTTYVTLITKIHWVAEVLQRMKRVGLLSADWQHLRLTVSAALTAHYVGLSTLFSCGHHHVLLICFFHFCLGSVIVLCQKQSS